MVRFTLRPYQARLQARVLAAPGQMGFIESPGGSGKTLVQAALCESCFARSRTLAFTLALRSAAASSD